MLKLNNLTGFGAAAAAASGAAAPLATAFDGVSDKLTRASALTGSNSTGKTITFSGWIYVGTTSGTHNFLQANGGLIDINANVAAGTTRFNVNLYNSSPTIIANVQIYSGNGAVANTWQHLCFCFDMSDTGKRFAYIDDIAVSPNYVTYTDAGLALNQPTLSIAANNLLRGRLANFFLDDTYIDLSDTATRRQFITAEVKPANWAAQVALSPLMAFSFHEPATCNVNEGTGGDFVIAGAPALASRGPNQDNCVGSRLGGNPDRMSTTTGPAAISGKEFTLSLDFMPDLLTGTQGIFRVNQTSTNYIWLYRNTTTLILLLVAGSNVLYADTTEFADKRNYRIDISFDLSDTGKRHWLMNGEAVTVTWHTYSNTAMSLLTPAYFVGSNHSGTDWFQGVLGEIYFNEEYIDLSAENPFIDSSTGLPNPVRKTIEERGVTPSIALPMQGNDPGSNLGSVTDLTVTSGPFTGARGGNEFWGRSAWNGVTNNGVIFTNYLSNASLGGGSALTTATAVLMTRTRDNTLANGIKIVDSSLSIRTNISEHILVYVGSAGPITITTAKLQNTAWHIIVVTADGTDALLQVKKGAAAVVSATTALVGTTLNLSGACNLFSDSGAHDYPGDIAMAYISDEYVDMEDADNWNIFFDKLDYPRDLTQAIADGDIPEPLVYMKFDDPDALGTNSGTGGDFTVNGTIQAGRDAGVI